MSKIHANRSSKVSDSIAMPADVFLAWLAGRPQNARVAVVADSDRLIADTGLLGRPALVDEIGRSWQIVVFRGDDLSFRLAFRKAMEHERIVIVLTRGVGGDGPIDVSYLADLLARNEAGEPLDMSLPAFFRRICPKINFPVVELRRYKHALLTRLENVPKATAKIVERWGRPDDWGRGQVAALVLLSHHASLTLSELWPNETDPSEFLAHAMRVLMAEQQLQDREAARPQVREHLYWLDMAPEELAAYLVLRLFARQAKLQNPSTQLAGLHIFPTEMPLARMEPLALAVASRLENDATAWTAIECLAEAFLTPRRLAKVFGLVPDIATLAADSPILKGAGVSPAILFHQIRTLLLAFFEQPTTERLSWVTGLADHILLVEANDVRSPRAAKCGAALLFAKSILQIEQQLMEVLPRFPHADALLDWYIQYGICSLEYELAVAYHNLEACEDEELTVAGQRHLFGGTDDLNPSAESLKRRIRDRLDELDRGVAAFVGAAPDLFARGPRGMAGYLKKNLAEKVADAVSGKKTGQVWILIFDGMRYDTWIEVVRPLLAEHFNITSNAQFCVLPSSTHTARTSLLAGCLPSEWRGYKGVATMDEATLVSRNLGLTAQELKTKLRFVTEADTTKMRMSVGFSQADARELNVLIYPISDECHDFKGDLAVFNRRIRTELVGDKAKGGARGIVDDLLRWVRAEDTAVVVSDHGFTELLPSDGVTVIKDEATRAGRTMQEDVLYRYVRGFRPLKMPEAVEIDTGQEKYFLAVGCRWFRRAEAKGTARYSHGGLSLAEMVVPAAVLQRVTEKAASVEVEGLPITAIEVVEDQTVELTFTVHNTGNVESEFEVKVRTNFGSELLSHRGRLPASSAFQAACHLKGSYRETSARDVDPTGTMTAVTVRLRHTDLRGNWRDAMDGTMTIPVKVLVKATKLETDALKGFDDI
jgi:hypothetical protein